MTMRLYRIFIFNIMNNEEFNEQFRTRTRAFAVEILNLCDTLPSNRPSSRIITFQLGKSASSTGANFRAFCRGRSKNEKFSKICTVVEEADESLYWLEVIRDLKYQNIPNLSALLQESTEILKITAKIKSGFEP
jgi:four helix bundle protein